MSSSEMIPPMKKIMLACSIIVLAAITAGCAAGPSEKKPKVSGSAVTGIKKSGDFSVSLTAVPGVVESGEGVSLTLVVRNLSEEDRTLELSSSQTYDFVAFEKGGAEVWRWSSGMMFTQVIGSVTIEARGSKTYKVSWSMAGIQPGTYTVEGYFLGLKDIRPSVEVELSASK